MEEANTPKPGYAEIRMQLLQYRHTTDTQKDKTRHGHRNGLCHVMTMSTGLVCAVDLFNNISRH